MSPPRPESYAVYGNRVKRTHPNSNSTLGYVRAQVEPGFVGVSNSNSDTVLMLGAKALFGYTWTWNSGFSLGLAGGMQYVYMKSDDIDSALDGILPSVDFNLGFSF